MNRHFPVIKKYLEGRIQARKITKTLPRDKKVPGGKNTGQEDEANAKILS